MSSDEMLSVSQVLCLPAFVGGTALQWDSSELHVVARGLSILIFYREAFVLYICCTMTVAVILSCVAKVQQ